MLQINENKCIPEGVSLRMYLKEFLEKNNISPQSAAALIRVSRPTIENYINGGQWSVKIASIRPLSVLLGVDIDDIVSAAELDEECDTKNDDLKACAYILSRFDITALKEAGIIPTRSKVENYESILKSYFGFDSIYEYDAIDSVQVCFSKTIRMINEQKKRCMIELWLKDGIRAFRNIGNPYDYRRDVLEMLLTKRIRMYTKDLRNGFKKIVCALFQIGITVIVRPNLKNSGIYGTTMILHDKPCIILSDHGKRYYKLWLSLIHELYHVLNDYDMLQRNGYHNTDENMKDAFFNEDAADLFAMHVLVPQRYIDAVTRYIDTQWLVEKASEEIGVHPSIMYGVCFEYAHKHGKGNILKNHSVLIGCDQTLKDIYFDPIKHQNVKKAINDIKETLYKMIG